MVGLVGCPVRSPLGVGGGQEGNWRVLGWGMGEVLEIAMRG